MRVAVVGHVEWVEFVDVDRLPHPGEIIHVETGLAVAAGGGAVAAVQLAAWGADVVFFTALGDDALGHRAHDELCARGVQVRACFRPGPQRRALTFIDAQRERTIVVIGERRVPHGADPLPWDDLDGCAAVYITGGDAAAIQHARRARTAIATARILPALRAAGIELDALVGSDADRDEGYAPGQLTPEPALVVRTSGARGGYAVERDGTRHDYLAVPRVVTGDTYGAGDTFAAGLAFALGEGRSLDDALGFAAARAADVVTVRGPFLPRTS